MDRNRKGKLRRPSWPALVWVIVAVLVVVAGFQVASGSDSGNTDARTAPEPPSNAGGALPTQLSQLWSATAVADDQRAVASDTVITSSPRGIRGLDPQTGEERWHYLRSNATMCDLTVLEDVVVAIFRTTGRCNEAVALEGATGVRRWYRNVGFSERLSLLGSGTAAVAVTPAGLAVLDAVGDSIRWRYNPPLGCELSSVGVGNTGVVVLERCETGTTWLAQFDLYTGKPQWRVPPPDGDVTVLGADGVVSLLVGQQLMILSARNGAVLSTPATDAAGPGTTAFAGQSGGRGVPLVYLSGTVYAIDPSSGELLWSVDCRRCPSNQRLRTRRTGGRCLRDQGRSDRGRRARSALPAGASTGDDLLRIERAGPGSWRSPRTASSGTARRRRRARCPRHRLAPTNWAHARR